MPSLKFPFDLCLKSIFFSIKASTCDRRRSSSFGAAFKTPTLKSPKLMRSVSRLLTGSSHQRLRESMSLDDSVQEEVSHRKRVLVLDDKLVCSIEIAVYT